MIRRHILVENKLGLHARAAAKLVQLTSRFASEIHLSREGQQQAIDCKSILGVLMMAAGHGSRLIITVSGPDEIEAAHAVGQLFVEKFGELS
jgi:phosphocarrier protein HPr